MVSQPFILNLQLSSQPKVTPTKWILQWPNVSILFRLTKIQTNALVSNSNNVKGIREKLRMLELYFFAQDTDAAHDFEFFAPYLVNFAQSLNFICMSPKSLRLFPIIIVCVNLGSVKLDGVATATTYIGVIHPTFASLQNPNPYEFEFQVK